MGLYIMLSKDILPKKYSCNLFPESGLLHTENQTVSQKNISENTALTRNGECL